MIGMRRPANEPAAKSTPAAELAPPAVTERVAPVETVTLGKIGDFLELDFGRLFTWLSRGMLLGLILAVIGGVAGGIYAIVATPKYTVSTDILIDPANLQALPDDLYQQPGQVDNAL
ncbi:MAG: lipopolysaccharide biosynthesis protein, partial [Sphingomonadales bacterium]